MKNIVIDGKTGEVIQSPARIKFTTLGAVINEDATIEDCKDGLRFTGKLDKIAQFSNGDILNHMETHWGMYEEALEETDYDYGTLRKQKYVASRVELFRRRNNLSYSHHVEVADLEPDLQDELLDWAEETGASRNKLRQEKKRRKRALLEDRVLPAGKYSVIYADPPWQYSNTGFDNSAESQYPTMAVDEIADLPIESLAADGCVLFLWATNPLLPEALEVMGAWGFEYKTTIAWIKDRGRGYGWWVRSKHEHLLIGVRGDVDHPEYRPDSCFEADRGEVHSRKPERAYNIIKAMYPHGKYIELFARNRREGWEVWGNEPQLNT